MRNRRDSRATALYCHARRAAVAWLAPDGEWSFKALTEPHEVAEQVDEVEPGIWHWRIHNSRIGGAISSSHALATDGGSIFIDPVRLTDEALAELPAPTAIVLTARCHQRAAWRYRIELESSVWLPEDASEADEAPDRRYREGQLLPGELRAIRTPGPERAHYCFLLERVPGVLFCSDLVAGGEDGGLRFVPPEYHEDPAETQRSVERLLELPFETMCLAHGRPVHDAKTELEALLRRSAGGGR